MSNSNSSSNTGGIGFGELLTIIFITLKLCKVIDWSWWWIFSPILIPAAIVGVVFGFIGLFTLWVKK